MHPTDIIHIHMYFSARLLFSLIVCVILIFPNISVYGISLVTIGFVAMIVGVSLEMRTTIFIRKKQKLWKKERRELMEKGKNAGEKRDEVKMGRSLLFYWFSPKYEKLENNFIVRKYLQEYINEK